MPLLKLKIFIEKKKKSQKFLYFHQINNLKSKFFYNKTAINQTDT